MNFWRSLFKAPEQWFSAPVSLPFFINRDWFSPSWHAKFQGVSSGSSPRNVQWYQTAQDVNPSTLPLSEITAFRSAVWEDSLKKRVFCEATKSCLLQEWKLPIIWKQFLLDQTYYSSHGEVPIPQYCPFCLNLPILRNPSVFSGSNSQHTSTYRSCRAVVRKTDYAIVAVHNSCRSQQKTCSWESGVGFWRWHSEELHLGRICSRWVLTKMPEVPQSPQEALESWTELLLES